MTIGGDSVSTILVADDDRDIRELVVFKLESQGHRVVAVADGPSALAGAREQDVDIAVLDWMMPGMSGLDVCRALRELPETSTLPIILLTAKAQEADVAAGFGGGADDYVTKPFSPRELASRVSALLLRTAARHP